MAVYEGKTEKQPNTEPQGVPEALDRFFCMKLRALLYEGIGVRFYEIFDALPHFGAK